MRKNQAIDFFNQNIDYGAKSKNAKSYEVSIFRSRKLNFRCLKRPQTIPRSKNKIEKIENGNVEKIYITFGTDP